MDPEDLEKRTFNFALRVIKLVKAIPQGPGSFRLCDQLFGAGTSVAANYRAARKARSKNEFISKLNIVQEEADESHFWLDIVIQGEFLPAAKVEPLLQEANELTAIFTSALKTANNNKPH